jgi:hypothetical protein
MIVASDKTNYKKGEDIREIAVEILQPIFKENAWECSLKMSGYGDVNRTLYGQSSIQALSFAMQHTKFNLTLLVEDGYFYFDEKENTLSTKEETLELLNATYGHGTMLDEQHTKAIHLKVIIRLQKAKGTEEEQNVDINYLRKEFADPKIIDYIFNHQPELTAIEIYEKAVSYHPIIL